MPFVLPVHLFNSLITSLQNEGAVLFVIYVYLFSRLINSLQNEGGCALCAHCAFVYQTDHLASE